MFSMIESLLFQSIYEDVINFEAVVQHFISLGTSQLQVVEDNEKYLLSSRISDIERRWKDVSLKVKTRQECMLKVLPICQQFSDAFAELLSWLKTANNELNVILPVANDQEQLVQQQRVVEVCSIVVVVVVVVVVVAYFILNGLLYLAFSANLGLLCMPHPGMGPLVVLSFRRMPERVGLVSRPVADLPQPSLS